MYNHYSCHLSLRLRISTPGLYLLEICRLTHTKHDSTQGLPISNGDWHNKRTPLSQIERLPFAVTHPAPCLAAQAADCIVHDNLRIPLNWPRYEGADETRSRKQAPIRSSRRVPPPSTCHDAASSAKMEWGMDGVKTLKHRRTPSLSVWLMTHQSISSTHSPPMAGGSLSLTLSL